MACARRSRMGQNSGGWRRISMVLADAIAEIRRLHDENEGLKEKLKFVSEDRDYWQHKWGNGNG